MIMNTIGQSELMITMIIGFVVPRVNHLNYYVEYCDYDDDHDYSDDDNNYFQDDDDDDDDRNVIKFDPYKG